MKRFVSGVTLLFAGVSLFAAEIPVARVADDAKAIDRMAEMAHRDFPRELAKRIVDQDIDLLRGNRGDGTYQYAGFERFEAARTTESFSVEPQKDDSLVKVEASGDAVFRVVLEMPTRRMVVTRNRRIWVENVEVELMPLDATTMRVESFPIKAWLEPGTTKSLDMKDIGRHVTVRIFARGDKDAGYGNLTVGLVQAKIVDDASSPYADAVASEKALAKAVEKDELSSVRAMASRVLDGLRVAAPAAVAAAPPRPAASGSSVDVVAPSLAGEPGGSPDMLRKLQRIEDLLTGSESERRQGLDELHQLIRAMR